MKNGRPIALQTDTVYGIAIIPGDNNARRRLYRMKRRPAHKRIAALCADISYASRIVNITPVASEILAAYAPGSVTVICRLRQRHSAAIFGSTDGTLGIRFPNHEGCQNIIRRCGGIIQASSANISGLPPALTDEDIRRYFPHVLIWSDPMHILSGTPSTVIDCTGHRERIIRS